MGVRIFLPVLLMALCIKAYAEPAASTTAVTFLTQGEAVSGLHSSPRLRTEDIAVLTEHLQSQHVYLKHLENVRGAVEKELSIVRLMSECDRLGSACTGRGIVKNIILDESKDNKADFSPPPSLPPSLPSSPPPSQIALPELVSVYHGTASLRYRQSYVRIRQGAKLGQFTIMSVGVDGVEIDGPRGRVFLSPRWDVPQEARILSSPTYRDLEKSSHHAR